MSDVPDPDSTDRADSPTAEAAPPTGAPAPLTSLSALLGDTLEGGAACAADGSCD